MSIGPGMPAADMVPEDTEGANDVGAVLPGMANTPGTRDPSSDTVAGSITNAYANAAACEQEIIAQGDSAGFDINLPDPVNPN